MRRFLAPEARAPLVDKDGVATPQFYRYLSGIEAMSQAMQYFTVGEGSPEGVVTASVPHFFIRVDGGASTTIYSKESGTGNTGWIGK